METCLIEKTRFVFITDIGRELVIIFYLRPIIYVMYIFLKNKNPTLKFPKKK